MGDTSQAKQRIEALLDENSFVEIGALVKARSTDFQLGQTDTPSDGVSTGYGLIDGRLVYVYAQDADVLGGSIGEMHAKKIVRLYDLALKCGAPVIGLIDSSGMRLQESTDALEALGAIYAKQVEASGVVPQVTAVFGSCGGGLAMLTALSDFVFMEREHAKLFVNSPNVVKDNYEAKCDTAGAAFQSEKAGTVDVVCTAEEIYQGVRGLISFLPSNNEDGDVYAESADELNRQCAELAGAIGDAEKALRMLSDDGSFFEVRSAYAREMAAGFIRMNGMTVGAVANRTEADGGAEKYEPLLTAEGCEKAARFVKFCDAFDIPLVTLTNAVGFAASSCEERNLAQSVSKLISAFAEATVPKINVVTKKAFGSAYAAMNSRGLGADLVIAWPDAQIGAMEAKMAAKILGEDKTPEEIRECETAYRALQNNVASAAARGYVDEIVAPEDTRKYVIGALEMLFTKKDERPAKKHGAF